MTLRYKVGTLWITLKLFKDYILFDLLLLSEVEIEKNSFPFCLQSLHALHS